MCFSAGASFSSGVVLTVAGGIAVSRAIRRRDPAFLPFAFVPIAFGLQQLCEGVVWRGLNHDHPELIRPAALGFLFFALGFWPVWMPAAVAASASRPVRVVAVAFLTLGTALAVLLAGAVLSDPDQYLAVRVVGHHVQYDIDAVPLMRAMPTGLVKLLYLLAVAVPLVIGPDRRVRVFGVLLTASAVITQVAYEFAFTSIWCFFAALLAVYLAAAPVPKPPVTPE